MQENHVPAFLQKNQQILPTCRIIMPVDPDGSAVAGIGRIVHDGTIEF